LTINDRGASNISGQSYSLEIRGTVASGGFKAQTFKVKFYNICDDVVITPPQF